MPSRASASNASRTGVIETLSSSATWPTAYTVSGAISPETIRARSTRRASSRKLCRVSPASAVVVGDVDIPTIPHPLYARMGVSGRSLTKIVEPQM